MKPLREHSTADQPLMAKALADAVGATKRQVQFWSDHGVLQFLPGSGGSRGNQRLYLRTELPFAAMACCLAEVGIQIGTIELAAFLVRIELSNRSTNLHSQLLVDRFPARCADLKLHGLFLNCTNTNSTVGDCKS